MTAEINRITTKKYKGKGVIYAFYASSDAYYLLTATEFITNTKRTPHHITFKDSAYYKKVTDDQGRTILSSSHLQKAYFIDFDGISEIDIQLDFKHVSFASFSSLLLSNVDSVVEYDYNSESGSVLVSDFPFTITMTFRNQDYLIVCAFKKRNPRLFIFVSDDISSFSLELPIEALGVINASLSRSSDSFIVYNNKTLVFVDLVERKVRKSTFSPFSRVLEHFFINSTCLTIHSNHTNVFTFQIHTNRTSSPPSFICPFWRKCIPSECGISLRKSNDELLISILGHNRYNEVAVGKIEGVRFTSPKANK